MQVRNDFWCLFPKERKESRKKGLFLNNNYPIAVLWMEIDLVGQWMLDNE